MIEGDRTMGCLENSGGSKDTTLPRKFPRGLRIASELYESKQN